MTIDDLLDDRLMRSAKRSFRNQAFFSSPAVEQKWQGGWNSYFKYACSEGGTAPVAHLATMGLSRAVGKDRAGRFGIALAAGDSSQNAGGHQETVEVFYPYQKGCLQIPPDLPLNHGGHLGGSGGVLLARRRIGITF